MKCGVGSIDRNTWRMPVLKANTSKLTPSVHSLRTLSYYQRRLRRDFRSQTGIQTHGDRTSIITSDPTAWMVRSRFHVLRVKRFVADVLICHFRYHETRAPHKVSNRIISRHRNITAMTKSSTYHLPQTLHGNISPSIRIPQRIPPPIIQHSKRIRPLLNNPLITSIQHPQIPLHLDLHPRRHCLPSPNIYPLKRNELLQGLRNLGHALQKIHLRDVAAGYRARVRHIRLEHEGVCGGEVL